MQVTKKVRDLHSVKQRCKGGVKAFAFCFEAPLST